MFTLTREDMMPDFKLGDNVRWNTRTLGKQAQHVCTVVGFTSRRVRVKVEPSGSMRLVPPTSLERNG